jgi:hypothetical protein
MSKALLPGRRTQPSLGRPRRAGVMLDDYQGAAGLLQDGHELKDGERSEHRKYRGLSGHVLRPALRFCRYLARFLLSASGMDSACFTLQILKQALAFQTFLI